MEFPLRRMPPWRPDSSSPHPWSSTAASWRSSVPSNRAGTFATLLTFTTFAEKSDSVIDEAYTLACASTGTSSRLDENRWYDIAREYYEEYLDQLNTASPAELQSHLDWLDVHFFARHPGYEGARMMIERFLVTHGGPLH